MEVEVLYVVTFLPLGSSKFSINLINIMEWCTEGIVVLEQKQSSFP